MSDVNKKDIKDLIQKESEIYFGDLLPLEDVKTFKGMIEEFKDTWTKKQIFRTETEARFSVLQDLKYPTPAAKYWQCVREQNVFLENLMALSFDYRKNQIKIKRLEKKIKNEKDELKKELLEVHLDQKKYSRANMEIVAKDRMRELKMWSKLKSEFDDGSFDTKDVNTHQLNSYYLRMKNKVETITQNSQPADTFNIIGQFETIKKIRANELNYEKKNELSFEKSNNKSKK